MSSAATAWAWSLDLGPIPKLVLLALADIASVDGVSIVQISHISGCCRITERSVYRALKTLRDIGLISVIKQGGDGVGRKANAYALNIHAKTLCTDNDLELSTDLSTCNLSFLSGCPSQGTCNLSFLSGCPSQGTPCGTKNQGLSEVGQKMHPPLASPPKISPPYPIPL